MKYRIIKDLSKFNTYTKSVRYNSWKIETEKGIFYYKEAASPDSLEYLKNEVQFCNFINSNKLPFKAPLVESFDGSIALFEWIDSPTLLPEGKIKAISESQISTLVDVMTAFPKKELNLTWRTPNTAINNYKDKCKTWSQKPLEEGLISESELSEAMKVIEEYLKYSEVGFQHGDFVGSHLFTTAIPTLIDGEHASNQQILFSDFARAYTNAFNRTENKTSVNTLVKLLAKKLDISKSELLKKSMVPLMIKSIGCLNDSINELETIDYRSDARTLFSSILNATFPYSQ